MLYGKCIFSQSGTRDSQNFLGKARIPLIVTPNNALLWHPDQIFDACYLYFYGIFLKELSKFSAH